MCLPPKTGCTNWQRGMVALLKNGEKTPEELTDYEVFYDLDRFNSTDMKKERATRSSSLGYNLNFVIQNIMYIYFIKIFDIHFLICLIQNAFSEPRTVLNDFSI